MVKNFLLFMLIFLFLSCLVYLIITNSIEKYRVEKYTNSILSMSPHENIHVQKRIKFYLGNLFYEKEKSIFPSKEFIKKKSLMGKHTEDFYNLIRKTKHSNSKFKIKFTDIRHKHSKDTLVKNRTSNDSVILRCIKFQRHWKYYYNKPKDIKFEKKKSKIIWRGTTTGNPKNPGNRFTLIENWFEKNVNINVAFSKICQGKNRYKKYVKNKMSIPEILQYKYILSVEGNDKDSGLSWKLNSNSLILMAKPTVSSWLMETTLIPNYHYILLKDDFSDLEKKFEWCEKNQDKCKQIIKNANTFMNQFICDAKEKNLEKKVLNLYFSKIINV